MRSRPLRLSLILLCLVPGACTQYGARMGTIHLPSQTNVFLIPYSEWVGKGPDYFVGHPDHLSKYAAGEKAKTSSPKVVMYRYACLVTDDSGNLQRAYDVTWPETGREVVADQSPILPVAPTAGR